MSSNTYDAIIVGASFAGLAAAASLKGNILLLDKKEIGTHPTSACGITLNVLEMLGCQDSLQQVYHTGYIHTPRGTIKYDLPYPLCSFDYEKFCLALARRSKARFIKTRVTGLQDGAVATNVGLFRSRCLIDASGWRAVLARSREGSRYLPLKASFGIETTVPHREDGIHFYFDRRIVRHGFGWVFPCGENSRIGVGNYRGAGNISESLGLMLDQFGLEAGDIHGGFFPSRLRQPVSGEVFLAGDSAGQCEPLSGFGTRPALYFGFICASILQRVLDGKTRLEQALQTYRKKVNRFRQYYRFLEWCQERPMELPEPLLVGLMKLASVKPICRDALDWHFLHSCLEEL